MNYCFTECPKCSDRGYKKNLHSAIKSWDKARIFRYEVPEDFSTRGFKTRGGSHGGEGYLKLQFLRQSYSLYAAPLSVSLSPRSVGSNTYWVQQKIPQIYIVITYICMGRLRDLQYIYAVAFVTLCSKQMHWDCSELSVAPGCPIIPPHTPLRLYYMSWK